MRISDWSSDVCSSDLLELASIKERQKRANPWELKVCPGTLRPLSEIPDDWQVSVTGTESARRIATLARDEIEESLRKLVLDDDAEKIGRASGRERVCM